MLQNALTEKCNARVELCEVSYDQDARNFEVRYYLRTADGVIVHQT